MTELLVLPKKKLEKLFKKRLEVGITCLGIDTASRSGWCSIKTTEKECIFDYGYIDIEVTDRNFKFSQYTKIFNGMPYHDKVVIEDTFYSRNVRVFSLLSRIGAIAYAVFYLKNAKELKWLTAVQARKYLGLKSNVKKHIVQAEFKEKTGITIIDNDIVDAVILALCGVLNEEYL